jgi:hypothetical protein
MKKKILFSTVAIVAFLLASIFPSMIPQVSAKTSVPAATDNTFTWDQHPDENQGPAFVYVSYSYPAPVETCWGWLKFDLSVVPSGCVITHARMLLFTFDVGLAGYVSAHLSTSDFWNMNNITWNNQPTFGSAIDTEYVSAIGAWYCFDVTSAAQQKLAGNKKLSIALTISYGDLVTFQTPETPFGMPGCGPVLEVSYKPACRISFDDFETGNFDNWEREVSQGNYPQANSQAAYTGTYGADFLSLYSQGYHTMIAEFRFYNATTTQESLDFRCKPRNMCIGAIPIFSLHYTWIVGRQLNSLTVGCFGIWYDGSHYYLWSYYAWGTGTNWASKTKQIGPWDWWFDVQLRYKASTSNSGFFKVILDGVEDTDLSFYNINLPYSLTAESLGNYGGETGFEAQHQPYNGQMEFYVDNVFSKVYPQWDVTQDGSCDVLDLIAVSKKLGWSGIFYGVSADVNFDGSVDVLDLQIVSAHLGETY